jgi:hypothetical protein
VDEEVISDEVVRTRDSKVENFFYPFFLYRDDLVPVDVTFGENAEDFRASGQGDTHSPFSAEILFEDRQAGISRSDIGVETAVRDAVFCHSWTYVQIPHFSWDHIAIRILRASGDVAQGFFQRGVLVLAHSPHRLGKTEYL